MNAARRPPGNDDAEEPFVPDFSEGAEAGLYLALFELFDQGLVITADELVLEANSAACRLLDRDYRKVAGRPLSELFPSEQDFLAARARVFIQGEPRGTLTVALPGGGTRALRFVAAPRIRPGVHALILSPADGAAHPAAAAVEEPADTVWPRLAAALEQPVIVLDDKRRVAAANAAALKTLGVRRAEFVGKPAEGRVDITWSASGKPQGAQIRTSRRGHPIDARVLPGPKPGWHLLILPPSGASGRDKQRTESTDSDAPSAQALVRMFARNPLPTLLCDGPELRIFAANDAATEAYGYSQAELCGMHIGNLRRTSKRGPTPAESGIWQQRRKDGTTFDAEILAYPIDFPGRPGAVVVMHGLREMPRLGLEPRLQESIDFDQLDVHFQPLVDVRARAVVGGEALMRWHHPELGLIPFQRFMGAASDSGLLARMGDRVLRAACERAAKWPVGRDGAVRVTVNVALEQVVRGDLLENVHDALAVSGLPATRLELDLDERVLNEDAPHVLTMLRSLHDLGVRLAVDDFGRGLASIPRLKRYPVRALKLDPALVQDVGQHEDNEAIVEAISSMAKVLGLDVLARGVRTAPQRAFLSALGCPLQQGPLFGPPMNPEEFVAYLAKPGLDAAK